MNVQALVATMNQTDYSIVDKMNLQTNAIVINQCDQYAFDSFDYNGIQIQFYSFSERGIGLSRNNALMRANADIVLFSDDDIVYYDGYEKQIVEAFEKYPDADIIAFNLNFIGSKQPRKSIDKPYRVHFYNWGKFGTARIAVKLDSIRRKNIFFSLLFGGGAKFSSGEDSIFIYDALCAGLRMYALPITIGDINDSSSTWFQGYTEKFFFDQGALFGAIYGKLAWLPCVAYAIKYSKLCKSQVGVYFSIKLMLNGTRAV